MARYRKIDVRMYGDEKFRALSKPQPNAQSLWVYLLTGPHTTNVPGLFIAGESGMSEALAWPIKAFQKAFAEVSSKAMAKADWSARVVWIPKAVVYNPPENPNVITGWRRSYDEVPECVLKTEALETLKAEVFAMRDSKGGFREAFREAFRKAFPEAFGKPFRKQEQEQEQEQEQRATRERLSPEIQAALAAFERWSQASRGFPLRTAENEADPILRIVESTAQESPIIRGSESLPRHKLVAFAADFAIKSGKEFKTPKYAAGTVKGMLDEWAIKGIPGNNARSGKISEYIPPPARDLKTLQTKVDGVR